MTINPDAFKTAKIKLQNQLNQTPKGKGACLIIIAGPDLGKVFFLDKPTLTIGREEGVDLLMIKVP